MKNLSLITCLAVTLLFFFSCTTPPAEPTVDMDSVKAEITQINSDWAAAINAKDVEGQIAIFADDAHSMPPNSPTLVGKDAIKANIEAEMAKDTSGMKTTIAFATIDVWAAGNTATESGTWTVSGEDGAVLDKGKYIALFEKRDGKYVCVRDIWNTDMPKKEATIAEAAAAEGADD